MTPSTILTQAAELISKPGAWTRRVFGRRLDGDDSEDAPKWVEGANCFCASGAIAAAMGVDPYEAEVWNSPAQLFLERHLRATDVKFASVPSWNDAPNRTQAEVVAALRLAADLAREAGE